VAATALVPCLAAAWGGEPLSLSLRVTADSRQLATLPRPPEVPQVPSVEDTGGVLDPDGSPEPGVSGVAPPGPFTLDDPIFADPRAELTVSLPPGIPVPTYPIVINAPVEALIDYFGARMRERFGLWIARSGRYLKMIQQVFRERGLPEELAYTAMIESGFSPRAVSRVGAKGMWQFMEATARRYGLLVNRWVDERLDPVKSTVAAAKYLGDLYEMFGHWFLAQAAYNAGEARVGRAIQRAKTSDFWALTQTRHLPDETKLFVPQILAAALITREPARYGFEVTMEPPLAYEEVTVKRPLDLEMVAELAGVSADEIRDLNPALLARITPPFGSYALRLPIGAGSRFEAALRNTPAARLAAWRVHRVGRNQSLAEIARLYRVAPQRLAEVNHLPGGRLRGITELVVPVSSPPATKAPTPPSTERLAATREAPRAGPAPVESGGAREVIVRRGDTLRGIATRYGVRPLALARLNGMELDQSLQPGARLKIGTP